MAPILPQVFSVAFSRSLYLELLHNFTELYIELWLSDTVEIMITVLIR